MIEKLKNIIWPTIDVDDDWTNTIHIGRELGNPVWRVEKTEDWQTVTITHCDTGKTWVAEDGEISEVDGNQDTLV